MAAWMIRIDGFAEPGNAAPVSVQTGSDHAKHLAQVSWGNGSSILFEYLSNLLLPLLLSASWDRWARKVTVFLSISLSLPGLLFFLFQQQQQQIKSRHQDNLFNSFQEAIELSWLSLLCSFKQVAVGEEREWVLFVMLINCLATDLDAADIFIPAIFLSIISRIASSSKGYPNELMSASIRETKQTSSSSSHSVCLALQSSRFQIFQKNYYNSFKITKIFCFFISFVDSTRLGLTWLDLIHRRHPIIIS